MFSLPLGVADLSLKEFLGETFSSETTGAWQISGGVWLRHLRKSCAEGLLWIPVTWLIFRLDSTVLTTSWLWKRGKDSRECTNNERASENEWTNEQTNEWTNERTNERMNEWTNEWMNEWTNEWMNEWTNERMNEWTNEWMNDYTKDRKKIKIKTNGWMNEWTQRIIGSFIFRVNEYIQITWTKELIS